MVATGRQTPPPSLAPEAEAFAAELARAAYEVALRHGITGPFADLELALWREVREVLQGQELGAGPTVGGPA